MIINTIKSTPVPIRVICIGNDKQPVTEKEIVDAQKYVKKHKVMPPNYHLPVYEYSVDRNPKPGFLLVRIGNKNRLATAADIQDIELQLSNVVHDPNLIIITHHTFKMEWINTSIANCPAHGFIVGMD